MPKPIKRWDGQYRIQKSTRRDGSSFYFGERMKQIPKTWERCTGEAPWRKFATG